MIRPITIVTFLLAGASGLYVYQSKHEVQLLDHTIEQTVHETSALRAQSRLLATEWEMLNNTDSLRQFSDTYLKSLKSITPSQFTSLADLNNRLPASQLEMRGEDEPNPVPQAAANEQPGLAQPGRADEVMPVPPVPMMPQTPRPIEAKAPDRVATARPAVADSPSRSALEGRLPETRQVEQRPVEQRPIEQRPVEQRPVEPRQAEQRAVRVADARPEARVPAAAAPKPIVLAASRTAPVAPTVNPPHPPTSASPALIATAGPYSGSLLGMAHGMVPAAPRPLPVSTSYNSN